jgi:hypothetical protein
MHVKWDYHSTSFGSLESLSIFIEFNRPQPYFLLLHLIHFLSVKCFYLTNRFCLSFFCKFIKIVIKILDCIHNQIVSLKKVLIKNFIIILSLEKTTSKIREIKV